MNYLQTTILRGFSGVLLALGLLAMPLALAHAAGSASITNLTPSSTVDVGTGVDFTIDTSGFTNPVFTVDDSFNDSSVANGDINPAEGYFAWTPITSDVGTHEITVNISDSLGDSASVTQQIIVDPINTPFLSIEYLSPGSTISAGQTVTFFALANHFSETPSYTVSDSFNGSTVTSSNISSSGEFNWTPSSNDVGTHVLTITAQNPAGNSASIQETLTVTSSGSTTTTTSDTSTSPISLSIESLSSPDAVAGQPVTFDAVASGFSSPSYTLSDSFSGSTISNADINSSGDFSWTPSTSDVGTHTISVDVTDSEGHTSTITQTITVQSSGVVVQNIAPSTTVPAETPLTFSVTAPNLAVSVYNVSDTFGGSTVANADITSAGNFSWTPTASDAGTHSLTITGRSSTGNSVSTTLQIIVAPVGTAVTSTAGTTTTNPAYDFTTSLALGDQSEDVTNLQTLLTDYGLYSGPITGYFGALTQTAVESFQAAHGIPSIGSVGPLTLAALNQLETTTPTIPTTTPASTDTTTATSTASSTAATYDFTTELEVGSTGDGVTALQNKLTALGDYSGPITGYYGTLTQTAVEQFQTANGLSPVGYVGPATRAALNG